jgi:nucleoside-diphosphate-sugar epimerase
VAIGDIGAETDWSTSLAGVTTIVHLMAHVHKSGQREAETTGVYRRVNTDGCLNLARQAAAAGVKRFVFISSIGVNGSCSSQPFTEQDNPRPSGPYAVAKVEAEKGLREIALSTGMEVIIIRPPLVYGPAAPGNFSRLIRIINKGYPLPLGAIHNQRSFLALDNLIDFILVCIAHPAAANETFLVADGEDISTTEFLQRIGKVLGEPVTLLALPMWMLKILALCIGKSAEVRQLCESLQIDISKARNVLGWDPPISVDEGLRRAVAICDR